jgi:hypothetical protein
MTKRLWERWLPLVIFLAVFCCHALYLRHLSSAAEGWAEVAVGEGAALGFAAYLLGQDYYLGFSYALSAGFVTWSVINYLSRRRLAMAAGAVGGVTVVGVLMSAGCFLTGCCGSPMLGIYATLFGMKAAGVAKPLIAAITVLSIGGSFWYLSRSGSRSCSDSRCGCQTPTRKES